MHAGVRIPAAPNYRRDYVEQQVRAQRPVRRGRARATIRGQHADLDGARRFAVVRGLSHLPLLCGQTQPFFHPVATLCLFLSQSRPPPFLRASVGSTGSIEPTAVLQTEACRDAAIRAGKTASVGTERAAMCQRNSRLMQWEANVFAQRHRAVHLGLTRQKCPKSLSARFETGGEVEPDVCR